jgi:hypothetical protein
VKVLETMNGKLVPGQAHCVAPRCNGNGAAESHDGISGIDAGRIVRYLVEQLWLGKNPSRLASDARREIGRANFAVGAYGGAAVGREGERWAKKVLVSSVRWSQDE